MNTNPHFWKERKVLVTGANGFIAHHLLSSVAQRGAHITALVPESQPPRRKNSGIIYRAWNVTDPLPRNCQGHYDIVFHLAAQTDLLRADEEPQRTLDANAGGTLRLLEGLMGNPPGHFVYVSSFAVYGVPRTLPIDESHPTTPLDAYGASKLAGEAITWAYSFRHRFPVAIARPFSVYGPWQNENTLVPSIIRQLLRGPEIVLRDTKPTRDFLYVKDATQALMRMAELNRSEVYNLGTGVSVSIRALVRHISTLLGVKHVQVRSVGRRHTDILKSMADIGKASDLLDWGPQTPLLDGLHDTINFYRHSSEERRVLI
ncbi:MAG: NAD(P)-dependent oxidoreductase [Candidatus Omnitrophica bacterium]|nr:NAD(P)-dependent oxidoreductase [Candidatus Omnitrophota bacterium]